MDANGKTRGKRGRKPLITQATVPPKGYYKAFVGPLLAVANGRISLPAYHLWAVVAMYAWERGVCDATNGQLAWWLQEVTTERVRQLLEELRNTGYVEVIWEGDAPGSGRRFLRPLDGVPSVEPDFLGSPPLAPDFLATPRVSQGITPKPNLPQIHDLGVIPQEEVNPNLFQDGQPPPPEKGGEGGNYPQAQFGGKLDLPPNTICPKSSLPPNPAWGEITPQDVETLAELLTHEGVFDGLARQRATALLAQMSPAEARAFVLAHALDIHAEGCPAGKVAGRLQWRVNPASGVWPTDWALAQVGQPPTQPVASEEQPEALGPPGHAGGGAPGPNVDEGINALATADRTAAQVWQAALEELEREMTRATFDAWLRPTRLVAYSEGLFTVAVSSDQARDWLDSRLRLVILRTLTRLVGPEAAIRFVAVDIGWQEEEE